MVFVVDVGGSSICAAVSELIKATHLMQQPAVVLVVDDDLTVLTIAQAMLKNLGYVVMTAVSAGSAADAHCRDRQHLDVLLLDGSLEQRCGLQLASALKAFNPDLRVVIMSGWTSILLSGRGLISGSEIFLQKPFTLQQLKHAMQTALGPLASRAAG